MPTYRLNWQNNWFFFPSLCTERRGLILYTVQRFVLFLFFLCSLSTAYPQQRPNGHFLTDSIEVGKPFKYTLSFRHSPRVEVFFPDTSAAFRPFEVVKLNYFPTETSAKGSLDSAVYTLLSFELAKIQTLSVPIWQKEGRDCTAIYSEIDSIKLREQIKDELTDSLHLRTDTQVVPLRSQTNYPYLVLLGLLISLIGTGIYLLFGEALTRQWELYQMFLRNREFQRNFTRFTRDINGSKGIENAEKVVVLWKIYLQRLERKPYVTYTTKEIMDNLPDEQLAEALRSIDGVIYGGVSSKNTADSLNILRDIATQTYRNKRIELLQQGRNKTKQS